MALAVRHPLYTKAAAPHPSGGLAAGPRLATAARVAREGRTSCATPMRAPRTLVSPALGFSSGPRGARPRCARLPRDSRAARKGWAATKLGGCRVGDSVRIFHGSAGGSSATNATTQGHPLVAPCAVHAARKTWPCQGWPRSFGPREEPLLGPDARVTRCGGQGGEGEDGRAHSTLVDGGSIQTKLRARARAALAPRARALS